MRQITIAWAGETYKYYYETILSSGIEIHYRVKYAKGSFVLIRTIQKDVFHQQTNPADVKLPKVFIDIIGLQILIDQRPPGWRPK